MYYRLVLTLASYAVQYIPKCLLTTNTTFKLKSKYTVISKRKLKIIYEAIKQNGISTVLC